MTAVYISETYKERAMLSLFKVQKTISPLPQAPAPTRPCLRQPRILQPRGLQALPPLLYHFQGPNRPRHLPHCRLPGLFGTIRARAHQDLSISAGRRRPPILLRPLVLIPQLRTLLHPLDQTQRHLIHPHQRLRILPARELGQHRCLLQRLSPTQFPINLSKRATGQILAPSATFKSCLVLGTVQSRMYYYRPQ